MDSITPAPPAAKLAILILEDEPTDAELTKRTLAKSGLDVTATIVATKNAFIAALDEFKPDIVLTDYKLPDFDGLLAIRIARRKYPDLPIIVVTGALGDEAAVELIKAGAVDCVLKDRMARLPAAVQNALAAARDITDRRRAEDELARASRYARSLIEASLDSLVTISAEGKITDVNKATEDATGIVREKLIGTDFASYFTDREKATLGYLHAFAEGAVRDYALSLRHQSGKIMNVLYNASVYRDTEGKVAGLFAAARDVTERVRDEEELRKYRLHLEEMVATRTQELAAANKELETFAYSVSHDLRAPLRAIDGFSRILMEDYADKLDPEGQRLFNMVRDTTVKLGRMIDDVLAFSSADRTEMKIVPLSMEALVGDAIKDLEIATAGRKVKFEIGPLPDTRGDAAMLQRVWVNLLDNALKFSAPKPDARIEIGANQGTDETVYFVRDNGVGFDMKYAEKLFGVFQRLHGGEFSGTGIGLAIVKRIVIRHGGRVWAEGKPNEGATFYFALPKGSADHV